MFKRNQIEEAISQVLEPGSEKPGPLLRSQIRRLLDIDRRLGRSKRAYDPQRAHFAFFSFATPGRGGENSFSAYEAFAMLTALRIMRDRWPQHYVVTLLREVRHTLEKEHSRILSQDPKALFDQRAIQQRARPGDLAVDNTDPVFLGIISDTPRGPRTVAICRGQAKLMAFLRSQSSGRAWQAYELASSAHVMAQSLAQTTPRNRGRAASKILPQPSN